MMLLKFQSSMKGPSKIGNIPLKMELNEEKQSTDIENTCSSPGTPNVLSRVKKMEEVSSLSIFCILLSFTFDYELCSILVFSHSYLVVMIFILEDVPISLSSSGPTMTAPQRMDEGTELEFMRVQVKDLSEKLETLRFTFSNLYRNQIVLTG